MTASRNTTTGETVLRDIRGGSRVAKPSLSDPLRGPHIHDNSELRATFVLEVTHVLELQENQVKKRRA